MFPNKQTKIELICPHCKFLTIFFNLIFRFLVFQTNKNIKSCWFMFTATMQHTHLHFLFLYLFLTFFFFFLFRVFFYFYFSSYFYSSSSTHPFTPHHSNPLIAAFVLPVSLKVLIPWRFFCDLWHICILFLWYVCTVFTVFYCLTFQHQACK